jgi:predicted dehydrogenase
MLKAAVIGLGVGEQHARYYHAHDGFALVGVADMDADKAAKIAATYDCAVMTWDQILVDPAINVVSIASFDHHHAEQVPQAIAAGKHIFVEKPLCLNRAELDTIAQTWKDTDCVLMSNLPLRKAPVFEWLKAQIAAGELGKIYAIDGEYLYGRIDKITKGWRKDIDAYSIIEGGGIHMLDLIMMVTGQTPTAVSTVGNQIATRGTAFEYCDYTASTFTFDSGMVGRLTANFGCVHPHQHILKVYGTKGTFILDDMGARVQTSYDPFNSDDYEAVIKSGVKKPKAQMLDLAEKPISKADLLGDLHGAITGNFDNKGLTLHEFSLMNVCLAAEEALQSQNVIKIQSFE